MELGNSKVCSLKKSLYGRKQSPRAWFKCFGKAITIDIGNNKTTILIVYVDDVILIGNDEEGFVDLKNKRVSEFQIKDLEPLFKYFLGMEFARSKSGFLLILEERCY